MKNLLAVLLLALAGCASLGMEAPQSFGDRLAYAEGTNTALLEAATDALDHREITSRDMEHVQSIHGQAKSLLGSARLLMGTDINSAIGISPGTWVGTNTAISATPF